MTSFLSTRRAWVAALIGAGLALAACSALVSFDGAQCAGDGDCAARNAGIPLVCSAGVCVAPSTSSDGSGPVIDGGVPDRVVAHGDGGPWGCVGLEGPVVSAAPSTITIIPTDGLSTLVPERNAYTVRTGVSVRLCAKRDPDCASPLVDNVVVSSDAGATLPTPAILDFYVEVTGPNVYPVLHFSAASSDNPTRLNRVLFVGTLLTSQIGTLAGLVQTSPDPSEGIILARPLDCFVVPEEAAGIGLRLTPIDTSFTVPFYTVRGLPSRSPTSTDSDGLGGFINVPPGQVTVDTFFPGDDDAGIKPVAIGEGAGFTRAGWMTIFEITPSGH